MKDRSSKETKKSKFRERLGDALLDLVVSAVFFGIGALILFLFGIEIDSEWLDGDTIILLGIVAVVVVALVVFAVAYLFRKKKKRTTEEETKTEEEE